MMKICIYVYFPYTAPLLGAWGIRYTWGSFFLGAWVIRNTWRGLFFLRACMGQPFLDVRRLVFAFIVSSGLVCLPNLFYFLRNPAPPIIQKFPMFAHNHKPYQLVSPLCTLPANLGLRPHERNFFPFCFTKRTTYKKT